MWAPTERYRRRWPHELYEWYIKIDFGDGQVTELFMDGWENPWNELVSPRQMTGWLEGTASEKTGVNWLRLFRHQVISCDFSPPVTARIWAICSWTWAENATYF